MAISYNIASAYTGTRTTSMPDPDNEGETIETTQDVTDVEVTFTDDSFTPDKVHTRFVNVCFDSDGAYDNTATLARVEEVMAGVEHKMALGVIA
jgi:hypothetical protein|tara:strand:+ start:506 stop:787 length:282 start_codon:yes stop_codon:yes gene_type:complete